MVFIAPHRQKISLQYKKTAHKIVLGVSTPIMPFVQSLYSCSALIVVIPNSLIMRCLKKEFITFIKGTLMEQY